MATAEVSIEKVKSFCSITRANIKKEREEKEAKILEDYIELCLKKHWWEFWKSPYPISEEQALNKICNRNWTDEWVWRLARARNWGKEALEVCDNLETLCKFSNVNMIRVSSEETALLDITPNKEK